MYITFIIHYCGTPYFITSYLSFRTLISNYLCIQKKTTTKLVYSAGQGAGTMETPAATVRMLQPGLWKGCASHASMPQTPTPMLPPNVALASDSGCAAAAAVCLAIAAAGAGVPQPRSQTRRWWRHTGLRGGRAGPARQAPLHS